MVKLFERGPDGGLRAADDNSLSRATDALPTSTFPAVLMFTVMVATIGGVFYGWRGTVALLGAFYAGYISSVPLDPSERPGGEGG